MTLIASIITSSKKKNWKKCFPRPSTGTLALDMEPSTLDPRQKDRLNKVIVLYCIVNGIQMNSGNV